MWYLVEELLRKECGINWPDGWLIDEYIRLVDTYGLAAALDVLWGNDHNYCQWQ